MASWRFIKWHMKILRVRRGRVICRSSRVGEFSIMWVMKIKLGAMGIKLGKNEDDRGVKQIEWREEGR